MSRFITPPAFATRNPQRWLEYGRLAALPLAILPIPPDSPLAASPTGRARLESPFRAGLICKLLKRTIRRHRLRGSCRRKPTEGEHLAALARSELFPFRHGLRRDTFPVNGDSFWLAVARKPHSLTQKFIVEAASEKKARHLACFDDSDASDADVWEGVEQLNCAV